jgi:hypothetical protein
MKSNLEKLSARKLKSGDGDYSKAITTLPIFQLTKGPSPILTLVLPPTRTIPPCFAWPSKGMGIGSKVVFILGDFTPKGFARIALSTLPKVVDLLHC